MEQKLRKTGIDLIGDVPWGTHFCQFYQTKKDLVDILCTGFSDVIDEQEAKSMGIRELLVKPASTSELKTAINRVLKK